MSDNTKIEWADATVNAVNGCDPVSPGCTNCYAMKQAHRFPARAGLTVKTNGGMVWTGEVRFNEKQLLLPLGWKRPRRIFWNAHGDLFHPAVPDEWIDRVFAVCALTPQHTHMILTKRSARMREYLTRPGVQVRSGLEAGVIATDYFQRNPKSTVGLGVKVELSDINPGALLNWPLPNVWLGVSVEDQARADERIPDLLATPAAVRFISAEPLLGPVDLTDFCTGFFFTNALTGHRYHDAPDDHPSASDDLGNKLDWVICGGESGPPHARPMHPDWARSLRDQCAAGGTAFHFKQWGEWNPVGQEDARQLPMDRVQPMRDEHRFQCGSITQRVGKKRAGRLLDGVEHNGLPGQPHA